MKRLGKNILEQKNLLYQLPGKTNRDQNTWLPLWIHLTDTAGVIKCLAKYWLSNRLKFAICGSGTFSEDGFESLCIFLALTHDIGKMTPVMVRKLICNDTGEITERLAHAGLTVPDRSEFGVNFNCSPHALAGQAILLKYGCPKSLAVVAGAHHGKPESYQLYGTSDEQLEDYPFNYYGTSDANSEDARIWENLWDSWLKYSLEESGFASLSELPDPGRPEQMLLTGLLIMADWIASNETYFPLISVDESGYDISSKERVRNGWDRVRLPEPWEAGQFSLGSEDFCKTFGFYPNSIQEAVIEEMEESISPGLVILEAPMGVGKTEAALAAAEVLATREGCGGLFFGLPTQATANGIFPRLEDWAKGQSEETVHAIRLAHGMAELNDDYKALFQGDSNVEEDSPEGGLIVHEWFKGRKQALLSEFVVGTVDQLLMAALKQKHVMLRHLGLGGKVIIVDEVHSYDAYMSQYLDRALSWLGQYGTPVIMLSATLPDNRRREMVSAYLGDEVDEWKPGRRYPLLTWTDGDYVRQKQLPMDFPSVTAQMERGTDGEVTGCLKEKLDKGGCAGVILNTVKRAQKFAAELKENLPDKKVVLIHSGFVAADRTEKEKLVLSRVGKLSTDDERDGLIIVGTQILEQSLDIDFDFLITDLCPMDLLLQRMGRLHRHDRNRPQGLENAVCLVLGMSDRLEPGSEKIYGRWLLQRTKDLIPNKIVLPEMISNLVQDTYEDASPDTFSDANLRESWEKYNLETKKKKAKAGVFLIMKPGLRRRSKRSLTIQGLLDTDYIDSGGTDSIKDIRAQAMVRDGEPSLEVLVMVRYDDGRVGFLPWQYEGAVVDANRPPSEKESICIARQRLRLPGVLCYPSVQDRTIDELENINRQYLAEWQRSPMLRGELILLLDERLSVQICGHRLYYDREQGLSYEKIKGRGEANDTGV